MTSHGKPGDTARPIKSFTGWVPKQSTNITLVKMLEYLSTIRHPKVRFRPSIVGREEVNWSRNVPAHTAAID